MTNYIGKIEAEWVDPSVELPEQGHGIIVRNSDGGVSLAEWHNSPWPTGRWVAWLRIGGPSDAIPREAVQAAVGEIGLELDETGWSVSEYSCTLREGIEDALKIIEHHTGVTPTEVTNG